MSERPGGEPQYAGHEQETPESVVRVEYRSLERGTFERYLEPGEVVDLPADRVLVEALERGGDDSKPDIPPAAEFIAGQPVWHLVCRDCITEIFDSDLRTVAGEHRAHQQAHPDHELAVARIDEGVRTPYGRARE